MFLRHARAGDAKHERCQITSLADWFEVPVRFFLLHRRDVSVIFGFSVTTGKKRVVLAARTAERS